MADTMYNVEKCGFFDSVNQDRLYTADDMNNPYIRLVSNGIFATQAGNPANDFLVLAGDGLNVTVKAGRAIIGNKWFNLEADMSVPLSVNSGILDRMDSIIARVDTRAAARAGYIVYRTGVSATEPTPPALDTTTGVYEYRLANVVIAPSASSISQANISDQRGSAECPWVTSLVDQVDTSVLFLQWQRAYQEYYAESTADFDEYTDEQRQAWQDFLDQVTSTLTVTPNVMRLEAYKEVSAGESEFYPARLISSFDETRDILMVFVNGLLLNPSMYSTSGSGIDYKITLSNAVPAGNIVLFEVFKSVVTSDLSSVQSMIQNLDAKISPYITDTGWEDISITDASLAPYDEYNTPQIRMIGKQVYVRGALVGKPTKLATIATLPAKYRPKQDVYITSGISNGSTFLFTVVFQIKTTGELVLKAGPSQMGTGAYLVPLDASYIAD